MSKIFQAIPTNLITGFLGSGKSTLILHLIQTRPDNSRWAVLVNEFGDVGIDGALFIDKESNASIHNQKKKEGLYIKEVPGGCLCCAAGLPFQMSLNLLIKQAQPERILIEPTGVGHPKKIMEILTGESYQAVLDVRATLCLVEAHKLQKEKYLENETFMDQLELADVLLASKADIATAEEIKSFQHFSQSFEIPKSHFEAIALGHLAHDLLDIKRNKQRLLNFHKAHSLGHSNQEPITKENAQLAQAGNEYSWSRFENNGHGYFGCGWIFNQSIVFDEEKLEQWITDKAFSRVKGIFYTNNGWLLFNRSEDQFSKQASSHTEDSRVELIEPAPHDWRQVEEQLLACIIENLNS